MDVSICMSHVKAEKKLEERLNFFCVSIDQHTALNVIVPAFRRVRLFAGKATATLAMVRNVRNCIFECAALAVGARCCCA